MRTTRTVQPSVFQAPEIVHPIAAELERASEWLDEHPELLDTIGACVAGSASCGRLGLTCETILRCAVLKHLMDYSYRQLEFALLDSACMQRFARVDPLRVAKKSALHSAIGAIDADAWQAINQRRAATRRKAARDRIRYAGAHRQHRDRDPHPGAVRQPPVVRRRAGADAAAAGGARAAAGGVVARPLPCCQAAGTGNRLAGSF